MTKCKNCGHEVVPFLDGYWHRWIVTDKQGDSWFRTGKVCQNRIKNSCHCKKAEPAPEKESEKK